MTYLPFSEYSLGSPWPWLSSSISPTWDGSVAITASFNSVWVAEALAWEPRTRPASGPVCRCRRPSRPKGFCSFRKVEREAGIEPAYLAWHASALPLCYSRQPGSVVVLDRAVSIVAAGAALVGALLAVAISASHVHSFT